MVYTAIKNNETLDLTGRIERLFKDRNVKLVLDELGISQTTYYRSIKTGIWKLEHVANIAKYFDVSLDYLVFGIDRAGEIQKQLDLTRDYLTKILESKK